MLTINKDDVVLAKPDEGSIVERDPLVSLPPVKSVAVQNMNNDEESRMNSQDEPHVNTQGDKDDHNGCTTIGSCSRLESNSGEKEDIIDVEENENQEEIQEHNPSSEAVDSDDDKTRAETHSREDYGKCGKNMRKSSLNAHMKYVHKAKTDGVYKSGQLVELRDGEDLKIARSNYQSRGKG